MVRLKNPMARFSREEAALPSPAVDDDRYLLARVDLRLREAMRRALDDVRGRVLIVGAASADLAFELAQRGLFVTLLDPKADKIIPLRARVIKEGLLQRLSLDTRAYGDIDFEPTSFEAMVLYDVFSYLGKPDALFNKCRRELRAGGRLLLRTTLAAGAPFPDLEPPSGLTAKALEVRETPPKVVRALHVRDRLLGAVYKTLSRARLLDGEARARLLSGELGGVGRKGPDWASLEAALSAHFVVTGVLAEPAVAYEIAELSCALRAPLGRMAASLIDVAARFDTWLSSHEDLRALAPVVLVEAVKQRELGRVFTLNHH